MEHQQSGPQYSFSGTGSVPKTITWNGKNNLGKAVNGTYRGFLELEYKKGNQPSAKSTEFTLDTMPPEVDVSLRPQPFSPDNDGEADELSISIRVNDISRIKTWEMEILDPVGNLFTEYSGKGEPAKTIIWHGISDSGELVQAAETYPLMLTVSDDLGNSITVREDIEVDVLVMREGDKLKIRISSIFFAPNSADYINVEEEKEEKNIKTLKRLAEILNKYSQYKIRIEGHANMIHWDDPKRAKQEQEEELIPLSKNRADAVKDALVEFGVAESRMTTVGLGGSQPIVPFSDIENRWKNRRVEFILIK
jgi:outer membrane protein OmpA-like peptidoglycan-associated protein